MNDIWKTALVSFLAVFIVVAAAGVFLGVATNDDSSAEMTASDHVEIDNPQYDADRVTSDGTPGRADIEMDTNAVDNEVVIHMGGSLAARDVEPLVNALVSSGNEVTVVADGGQAGSGEPITFSEGSVNQAVPPQSGEGQSRLSDVLDEAHGLISLGVSGYSEADIEEIGSFIDDGGRVVMAVNPSQAFAFGDGHSQTFSELGMYTKPGYVYNLAENDLNYQRIFAEPDGSTELTEGVERVVFDSATPVEAANPDETMQPIEGSQLSVTREETDLPVLVREGDVALVGDTGFLTPENTQRADNDVFVANIAEFLVEADRTVETGSDTTG